MEHQEGMSAFQSPLLKWLFDGTGVVLAPFMFFLTAMLSPFLPTTKDLRHPYKLLLQKIIAVPFYFLGVVVLLLPMIVAYCIRSILHQFRSPFCISYNANSATCQQKGSQYSIATANVCLLPEIMAKFNNLDKTSQRAKLIGERICIDQSNFTDIVEPGTDVNIQTALESSEISSGTSSKNQPDDLQSASIDNKKGIIRTCFPQLDFICLQETFDRDYSKIILSELHKTYPWIVHDVGYSGPRLNYCGLNSGLMLCSRYRILNVRFKPFSASCGFCVITGKGLLMVKVCLSDAEDENRKVGYVFNTHLQAFQGDKPVVESQLSEIEKWTVEFRDDTYSTGDSVVFDVLCGDFNIDNMSPGEAHLARHELFNTYIDICRERPGKDYDWTIGTEMRASMLHDDVVATPEGLKLALEDPYLRQQYIIDADLETATMESIYNATVQIDKQGNLILSPVGGRRRIDFLLYRNENPIEIKEYAFVTRLALLTDHIPVAMTFTGLL